MRLLLLLCLYLCLKSPGSLQPEFCARDLSGSLQPPSSTQYTTKQQYTEWDESVAATGANRHGRDLLGCGEASLFVACGSNVQSMYLTSADRESEPKRRILTWSALNAQSQKPRCDLPHNGRRINN